MRWPDGWLDSRLLLIIKPSGYHNEQEAGISWECELLNSSRYNDTEENCPWFTHASSICREITRGNLILVAGPSMKPKICSYCKSKEVESTWINDRTIHVCQDCYREVEL